MQLSLSINQHQISISLWRAASMFLRVLLFFSFLILLQSRWEWCPFCLENFPYCKGCFLLDIFFYYFIIIIIHQWSGYCSYPTGRCTIAKGRKERGRCVANPDRWRERRMFRSGPVYSNRRVFLNPAFHNRRVYRAYNF